jgi:hypothetical protein
MHHAAVFEGFSGTESPSFRYLVRRNIYTHLHTPSKLPQRVVYRRVLGLIAEGSFQIPSKSAVWVIEGRNRKEAWPFHINTSGVHLWWDLKEPQETKGSRLCVRASLLALCGTGGLWGVGIVPFFCEVRSSL